MFGPIATAQTIEEHTFTWSSDVNQSCVKIFDPNAVPICINAIVYMSDGLNLTEYLIWFSLMSKYNPRSQLAASEPVLR